MSTKARKFFLCLAVILIPFIFGFKSVNKIILGSWIPYWDIKNSAQILKNNFLDKINEINPFVYVFDKEANIINACKDQTEYKNLIDIAKENNIKIILTVTNDILNLKSENKLKDPDIVHRILSDNELKKKHLRQLMDLIEETDADGIDIDYENINIEDKYLFSEFIKDLGSLVHRQNKILYVTVQQKTQDHQRAGAGSVDWKEISPYVDKIIIMCYPYYTKTTKPGPICPAFWLKEIIQFAISQIPREKISIGLALHGYNWSKVQTNSLSFKIAAELIKRHSAELKWDRKNHAPYFIYYDKGAKHEVWFENRESLAEKIKIIKKYKISNIAFWHLGILEPSFSDLL